MGPCTQFYSLPGRFSLLKPISAILTRIPQSLSGLLNLQLPLHTVICVKFSVNCTYRPLLLLETIQSPRNRSLNYHQGLSANPSDYRLHWCQREQHIPTEPCSNSLCSLKRPLLQNEFAVSRHNGLHTPPDRADNAYPQLRRRKHSQFQLTFRNTPESVLLLLIFIMKLLLKNVNGLIRLEPDVEPDGSKEASPEVCRKSDTLSQPTRHSIVPH